MRDHFAAFRKQHEAPAQSAPEAANSNHDPDETEERAAMAVEGGVPAPYVDAFARMQVVHPIHTSREEWARMVDDAGRFLDTWGETAVGLGWLPDDLFGEDGLVAALKGTAVTALCSEVANLSDGRTHRRRSGRGHLTGRPSIPKSCCSADLFPLSRTET